MSHKTQSIEQTYHGVNSEVEFQVEISETLEAIEVEATNEVVVPKVNALE